MNPSNLDVDWQLRIASVVICAMFYGMNLFVVAYMSRARPMRVVVVLRATLQGAKPFVAAEML